MSLKMIRPVLGRKAFAEMLEQAVERKSDLVIVFLHKQNGRNLKEGSAYLDYNPKTDNLGAVVSLYITGAEYGKARFLFWIGPVNLFINFLAQCKETLGHNSIRDFVFKQESVEKHEELEQALRRIEFRFSEEVLSKHPDTYTGPKKKRKYTPEKDKNQPILF
jgi:hypothetical protein